MEEWLAHISNSVGVDKEVARLAVGHVFGFLQQRHSGGVADELITKFPGATEAIEAARTAPQKGVSGVLEKIGGAVGGSKGDLVVLTTRLAFPAATAKAGARDFRRGGSHDWTAQAAKHDR